MIQRREAIIPGHPDLRLVVYGVDRAVTLASDMEQGCFVERNGVPLPRSELNAGERQLVHDYLSAHHPEHALLFVNEACPVEAEYASESRSESPRA